MADEKNAKKEKVSFFARLMRFFKLLPGRVATPFKNMWHEMRKVTWPTRKDLVNYTVIVLLFILFMGTLIGVLDLGASALIDLLIS
jgi:preprotein translocase SecE subunit